MVSIHCLAYNHEPYIRECLDGFIMQKADFRFEAIVHDDASTDGTADIIKEYAEKYPEIIKPIFEIENQYSKSDGAISKIMREHTHGKYIAICEGDDYWIDPYKLHKQVSFLEENPDYGMAYSKAYFRNGDKVYGCHGTADCSFEGLLWYSNFPTLTRLFRKSLDDRYHSEINPESKTWMMGDYPQAFFFVFNSKIKCFDEYTAVYRLLDSSASHSKDRDYLFKFYDSADDVRYFFIDKNNKIDDTRKEYLKRQVLKRNITYKISYCINNNLMEEAEKQYRLSYDRMSKLERRKWWIFIHSKNLYNLYFMIMRVYGKIIKTMINNSYGWNNN